MFTEIYQNVEGSPEPWIWISGFGRYASIQQSRWSEIVTNMISTSENEIMKHNF